MQGKKGEQAAIRDLVRNELKRLHSEVRWNNNKMFQTAKTPDDTNVYIDGQEELFLDPSKLINFSLNGANIVKANRNLSSAIKTIELIDLKLNVFGPIEDQVYSAFPILIKNIRRGNTILKYQVQDGFRYTFGRKGLEKFFDLRYEHISPEQRYDDTCLDDETHMHKNYILAGPLKAILEGHQVEVVKTLKANGENVQVSWNPDTKVWIVCSKNVGLIAQQRSDIGQYSSERFGFAKEMAYVWFDTMQALEQKHGSQIIDQLKSDLSGKTLIGEYIGSQEHQHLVKYSRVTIIFYAVVDNNSSDDCWPCDQAWKLFAKYGLDKVHATSLGLFTDFDKLNDSLCQVFKDVAKSEIAKDEEGNVLYFIKRAKEGAQFDKVLSLSKLKTLEYRLFRKMREKLRGFYAQDKKTEQKTTSSESIKKFIREAKELSDEHELPRPLEYYIELFKTAFDFIDSDYQTNVELLHKEYVTFSEHLLAYFSKQNTNSTFANQSSFFVSDVLDQQQDYCVAGPVITTILQEKKQSVQKVEESKEVPKQENQRVVVVIIPIATPGSGKSFCWNAIKEHISHLDDWSFQEISSDEIRGQLINFEVQCNGCTRDEAFAKTIKSGPSEYSRRLKDLVKQSNNASFKAHHLIYLDKNYPKDQIDKIITEISSSLPGNVQAKFLYLIPECNPNDRYNSLPFSTAFMLQAFSRCQKRTSHSTLDNSDPEKLVEIQTMFMLLNKGVQFDQKFVTRQGLDGYLRLPMANEKIQVPEVLKQGLIQVIDTFKGVGKTNQKPIKAFIELLQTYDGILSKHIEPKTIVDFAIEQILQVFKGNQTQNQSQQQTIAKDVQPKVQKQNFNPEQKSVVYVKKVKKPPTYIGISAELDPKFNYKLGNLFETGFTQAGEPKEIIDELKQIAQNLKPQGSFKCPNSYHVTSLFIAGNKDKLNSQQYQNFEEGVAVDIEIRALVYVPNKLIAGVCFPKFQIENVFPHMTLMISEGWPAMTSNTILNATCNKGQPFFEAYQAASAKQIPAAEAGVITADSVKIEKQGNHEVIFVLLRQPILFNGVTKGFN